MAVVSDYCFKLPDFSQSEKVIGHLHICTTGTARLLKSNIFSDLTLCVLPLVPEIERQS